MRNIKILMENQLILNPVENLPYLTLPNENFNLHGLYVTDNLRTTNEQKASIIQFSGRTEFTKEVKLIYSKWATALKAEALSMRLLSGLHAHIILFMNIGMVGDNILLLPEVCGGHFATKKILKRLGFNVFDMVPDMKNNSVDICRTKNLIRAKKIKFIFVDRSEGIYFEDFSYLLKDEKTYNIFDSSHYLSNIITGDFMSPFDMGFNLIISTLHKNFPGTQKALVCTNKVDENWKLILDSMSSYVSNFHPQNIFELSIIIENKEFLHEYSKNMIQNATYFEEQLRVNGFNVVVNNMIHTHTHHIWIRFENKEDAFDFYKNLEKYGLLVNYRKLPYELGYGIRIGTQVISLLSITHNQIDFLAKLFKDIRSFNFSQKLEKDVSCFITKLHNQATVIG